MKFALESPDLSANERDTIKKLQKCIDLRLAAIEGEEDGLGFKQLQPLKAIFRAMFVDHIPADSFPIKLKGYTKDSGGTHAVDDR